MFVDVARFKTRNVSGGTVSLSVLRKGETRIVEVEPWGRGSVGLFGSTVLGPTTRGDGGAKTITTTTATAERGAADAYCGTCRHLEYAIHHRGGSARPLLYVSRRETGVDGRLRVVDRKTVMSACRTAAE